MPHDMEYAAIALEEFTIDPREVARAEALLRRVTGVRWVYANALTETIYVQFDPDFCSPDVLAHALGTAGFREVTLS